MLIKSFIFFSMLNLYAFRILSENNNTFLKANITTSLQKSGTKSNEEKDNKVIYMFGLPIFIPLCMLSLLLFMIIIAKLCCIFYKYRKRTDKKGEIKENDNKKIELSKINKDHTFCHIYISSLD